MVHKKILIPKENPIEIMTKLGSLHNYISFVNLNKDVIESQKPYFSMIQRCEELNKNLIYIDNILYEEFNLKYEKYKNFEFFKVHLDEDISYKEKKFNENYFDLIENEINEDCKKIKEQHKINKSLYDNYLSLLEYKYVLEKIFVLFSSGEIIVNDNFNYLENNIIENKEEKDNNFNINYIAGMCNVEDILKISKSIFRKGKNRAIPNFFDIKIRERYSEVKNYFENKTIFLICIQGNYLIKKVKDILLLYNCSIYTFAHNINIFEKINEVNKEISDKIKLISEGHILIKNLLSSKEKINNFRQWNNIDNIADDNPKLNFSIYHLYSAYLKMQKLIYENLNKCVEYGQFYIGEVWIPEIYFEALNNEIKSLPSENERILVPQFEDFIQENNRKIPTFFRINEFTSSFQEIVFTYGIPRYKEINPGLFTIITFPFLFGVMFGDIGHGSLLLILSIYICFNKNSIYNSDSILKQSLKFRYFILIMGIFSLFCGFIYNDFMGIPLSFFNSCYEKDTLNPDISKQKPGCIYPVGIDPKWYAAHNELAFTNSFKMKISVIIGVFQMLIGIILRGLNNLFFKDKLGLCFEFIPYLIFFSFIFIYMIVLIYIKWLTNYSFDTSKAPSIITILMNLALKGGSVDGKPIWGSVELEQFINRIFFILSILCIPVMLFAKPGIIIYDKHKKEKVQEENNNEDNYMELMNNNYKELFLDYIKEKQNYHESAVDILVHQIIETIEFVLGCVSNTASYLRLWALSLAHAQLSKVFFEKSLLDISKGFNFIIVIFGYFIFANITVGVLMGMDLLEAFLHTLRLHWVEFQNKFYYADGILFEPFSFKQIFEDEN